MFCNVPNVKIGKNRVWFLEIGCAKHTLHPWLANALLSGYMNNYTASPVTEYIYIMIYTNGEENICNKTGF